MAVEFTDLKPENPRPVSVTIGVIGVVEPVEHVDVGPYVNVPPLFHSIGGFTLRSSLGGMTPVVC